MTTQSLIDSPVHAHPSTSSESVSFHGKGGEYFGIWIVNIALTVITLGIYSAWAKVRNNRYFYGHTEVAGASFEYLATGGQILKGRLIAMAIFVGFSVISAFASTWLYATITALFVVASPWLINSGLRFSARYSAYRGIRFRFGGRYWDACKAFLLYPLLGVITLGFMMPHSFHYSARYIVENHSYGDKAFKFDATVDQYKSVVYGLVIGMVAFIALIAIGFSADSFPLIIIGYLAVYGLGLAFKPLLFNLYWRGVDLEGNRFSPAMPVGRYMWVFISNSLVVGLTLGLAYPWAKVRMARLTANSLSFRSAGNLGDIVASQSKEKSAIGEELGQVYDVDVGFGI